MLNYARIEHKNYILCIDIEKIFKIVDCNSKTKAYKDSTKIDKPILIVDISNKKKKENKKNKIILMKNKKLGFYVSNIKDISHFHFNPCQVNLIKKYNLNPEYITKTATIDDKMHFLINVDSLIQTLQKEGKL